MDHCAPGGYRTGDQQHPEYQALKGASSKYHDEVYSRPGTQFCRLEPEEQMRVAQAGAGTFVQEIGQQGVLLSEGALKGTENFVGGIATAIVSAPIEAAVHLTQLASNPNRAVNETMQAGTEMAALGNCAHQAYNAALDYAHQTVTGRRDVAGDLEGVVTSSAGACQASWERFDRLPTDKKAEFGTEALLSLVPVGEGLQAMKFLGNGGRMAGDVIASTRLAETGSDVAVSVKPAWLNYTNKKFEALIAKMDETLSKYSRDRLSVGRESNELAGAGCDWRGINERRCHEVPVQCHKNACVAAVGEMLSDGAIDQQTLVKRLEGYLPMEQRNRESPLDIWWFAKELGAGWKFKSVKLDIPVEVTLDELLEAGSPWGTALKEYGKEAHAVVVDGAGEAGRLKLRDPAEGTRYEMERKDFLSCWTGRAVARVATKE